MAFGPLLIQLRALLVHVLHLQQLQRQSEQPCRYQMQLESIALREPMQHPIPFALAALLARYLEVFHPLALLALLDLTLVPSLVSARSVLQGTMQRLAPLHVRLVYLGQFLEGVHPLALLALLDLTLVPSLVSARIVLQGTTQLRALRALPVCQVATHQSPGQRSVCLVLEALVLAPPLVPSSRF